MKHFTLSLVLFLLLTPAFAGSAPGNSPTTDTGEDAGENLELAKAISSRAVEKWRMKGDYQGALEAFNQAVDLAPDSLQIRLDRASFFHTLTGIVTEDQREQFHRFAREDYLFISRKEPNSIIAGIARDMLVSLEDARLLPDPVRECPSDAVDAKNNAEDFFHTGQYKKALKYYGTAADACPDNSGYWSDFADCYFMLGEYAEARSRFLKALEVDPWNRQAHRFLADTEFRLKNNEAGLRQVVLAVVSDPTYEAAWGQLRSTAGILGREYLRVYGEKSDVTMDEKGDVTVTIPTPEDAENEADEESDSSVEVDEGDETEGDTGEIEEEPDSDNMYWTMYGIAKATLLADPGAFASLDTAEDPPPAESKKREPLSPLELELQSTKMTLTSFRESAEQDQDEVPFWTMLHRADQAGYLKEAVFLHMLDAELVPDYREFREENRDRLIDYIEALIVPPRKAEKQEEKEIP